jgi:tRNA pseudouridine-54 N-methylase
VYIAAASATILFGLFEYVVSNWCIRCRLDPVLHSALQACIVGLGAGFALWVILMGVQERRRIVESELKRVAELNHSVRNSLEVIVLALHAKTDCDHKQIVLECTDRIDEKLRELFPVRGKSKVA